MAKAEATRLTILQKAYDLVYQKGYQATSIDDIIATTQVTKGAFFYHFKNKEQMGLGIINELMYPKIIPLLEKTLNKPNDVRVNIYETMELLLFNDEFFKVEFGCPVINLIDEMAALNPAFQKALTRVINKWQTIIEAAILKAQEKGQLSQDNEAGKIALHVIANYGGARYMGKLFGKSSYSDFLNEFEKYLKGLK
jgi:AcrR family transcriptional regulator